MNIKSKFFNVSRSIENTSEGKVQLPILYYDASMALLLFWVDSDKITPKLQGTGLSAYKSSSGKVIVGIAFYEYRNTTIGSYDEVGLGILVHHNKNLNFLSLFIEFLRKTGKRTSGFFIIDLPVTTPIACAAGRELYGYPKFVTDIFFKLDQGSINGQILYPKTNQAILKVEGNFGRGIPFPATDLIIFSHHEESILKTIVNVNTIAKTHLNRSVQLKVGSVQHQMATNLMDMGLQNACPFLIQTSHRFQSRLNPGDRIIPWKQTPFIFSQK